MVGPRNSPPHELGQVGLGRLNDQMKMVAHKHIGVHADTEDLLRDPKSL